MSDVLIFAILVGMQLYFIMILISICCITNEVGNLDFIFYRVPITIFCIFSCGLFIFFLHIFSSFKFYFIFNWKIITIQDCDGFCSICSICSIGIYMFYRYLLPFCNLSFVVVFNILCLLISRPMFLMDSREFLLEAVQELHIQHV